MRDVLADAELAAELALDIGRGRQVVGMDMGLDQPFELEADARAIWRMIASAPFIGDAAGGVVDVHDRIDDGAGRARPGSLTT